VIIISLDDKFRLRKIQKIKLLRRYIFTFRGQLILSFSAPVWILILFSKFNENQDKGGEKKTLACRHEVISSKPGRPGLTSPRTRSDRPIQSVTVGCHPEEKYDIIHIKVPHPSNLFDKVCFSSNS
jgi:hypothetical protein